MKKNEDELVEMYVKFWVPYAAELADKDVDVIERVPAWLPKISGMTIEQLSPYEVRLYSVPSERTLEIKEKVKAKVVNELGWKEEPSHVVSIGVVADPPPEYPYTRTPTFFRTPQCMYTVKTPGYVRLGLGDGLSIAALTDGTFLGGKVVLYLHGNDEDIYESRESLKPVMPPACNLALVAYRGLRAVVWRCLGIRRLPSSTERRTRRACANAHENSTSSFRTRLASRSFQISDTAIFSQNMGWFVSAKSFPSFLQFKNERVSIWLSSRR